jgi:hypothetical protein
MGNVYMRKSENVFEKANELKKKNYLEKKC